MISGVINFGVATINLATLKHNMAIAPISQFIYSIYTKMQHTCNLSVSQYNYLNYI